MGWIAYELYKDGRHLVLTERSGPLRNALAVCYAEAGVDISSGELDGLVNYVKETCPTSQFVVAKDDVKYLIDKVYLPDAL